MIFSRPILYYFDARQPEAHKAGIMSHVPVLEPREVMQILENLDFTLVRQKGSHCQFRHADGRGTTVPNHKGRDISPFLLRQIARDIGLNIEDFLKHR